MAFLTLNAVTFPILTDGAAQPESDVIGQTVRTFSGALRSTRRAVKRKWQFTTARLTFAEEAILLGVIGTPDGGNVVTAAGNFNNGVSVSCEVTVTNREFFKISSTAIKRRLTLQLLEV